MNQNRRLIVLGLVLILCIGYLYEGAGGQSTVPSSSALVPFYPTPGAMDLCGEAVPLHEQEVRERFDREFTLVVYNHAQVYLWLKRMERYFPALEKQLTQSGLPKDLRFVAVAESDLMSSATSPAGAAGPWQFIPSTGTNYGLSQSKQIDERRDFEMSTSSAFRYLKDLYDMFQSWPLALAAYNCGEKRIQDEMKKQKVSSYYQLRLPLETERYVFRILAIKEILLHPDRYGYVLPRGAGYPPQRFERTSMKLGSQVPLQMVADAAGITYRDFKSLNPAFISDSIPEGSYTVRVPEGKGREFTARVEGMRSSGATAGMGAADGGARGRTSRVVYHKVAKGETLTAIAARYDVSAQSLREWNQLASEKVRIGQTLKVVK